MSRPNSIHLTLTTVRQPRRKTKLQRFREESKKKFVKQLLEIIQNPWLEQVNDSDIFVSVVAEAVKDLS